MNSGSVEAWVFPGITTRRGTRAKSMLTEAGPVEIEVPRDRDGSFEPKVVRSGSAG